MGGVRNKMDIVRKKVDGGRGKKNYGVRNKMDDVSKASEWCWGKNGWREKTSFFVVLQHHRGQEV